MATPDIWPDTGTVATIASVVAAFSVTMLAFRIQRELQVRTRGAPMWIPPADWLLLVTSSTALLLVLLPLVAAPQSSWLFRTLPPAGCAATLPLLALYPFALLAHYRFIFSGGRTGVRGPSEPSERHLIATAVVVSITAFIWTAILHAS